MATTSKTSKSENSASSRAAEAAHEAVDRAADKAEQAEAHARHLAEEAGRRTDDAIGSVQTFVRERPIAALGIAFVAGALATTWLRR